MHTKMTLAVALALAASGATAGEPKQETSPSSVVGTQSQAGMTQVNPSTPGQPIEQQSAEAGSGASGVVGTQSQAGMTQAESAQSAASQEQGGQAAEPVDPGTSSVVGTQSQAGMTQGDAAQEQPAGFAELDKDGDGYISESEASSELRDQWSELDSNTDNRLDQVEFARSGKEGTAQESTPQKTY